MARSPTTPHGAWPGMNLAIRGIEGRIEHGDSFHNDRHPDLRADYILANPPFNVSDWGGDRLRDDKRWEYGVPPMGNANFAWVQHFLYHLAPRGIAGFVLANGSMSSNQSGEGEIRKNIIEAGLVDCIIALPGQLFRSTQIPACLWFLRRGRDGGERRDETLFIDARKLGHMLDRTRRDLSPEDIARIANTYHAWRGGKDDGEFEDVPGFCKSSTLEEIRKHGHVLTPGRYVGAAPQEDDGEPFEEKMTRLSAQWREQQAEAKTVGRRDRGGTWNAWGLEDRGHAMKLELTPLEDAVAQLEEALDIYNSDLALTDPRLKRHLRAAVIQAFEFTYELSFRMLRRYLELASANPAEIDELVFNDVIREAYGQALLRSELPEWLEFRRNRGTTSHAYNEEKAQEVFESVPDFLQEARYLLNRLQERNESLD